MRPLDPAIPRSPTPNNAACGQFYRRAITSKSLTFVIIIAVIAGFALVSVLVIVFVRIRRRRSSSRGQDADTGGQWSVLSVLGRTRFGRQRYEQTSSNNPDTEARIHQLQPTTPSARGARSRLRRTQQSGATATPATRIGATVDRNTSIRSVMTLPAYRPTAGNNEQVLGREGDRDGVDVIVDFPTAEEEEALREEEMEAIYQIRVARREQIAERDDLRRQRREARERGDSDALTQARARSRAASNNSTFDELRQEVSRIQDQRQRSVSSVSYADLGVARHDGTRIRANSNESERMGLLSDAASIAISTRSELRSPGLHRRDRSASSLVSVDSEMLPDSLTRTRGLSRSTTPRISNGELAAGSSPDLAAAGLGAEPIPPPEYEEVSLEDDAGEFARSTTPLNGPPPDYFGPGRRISQTEDTRTGSVDVTAADQGMTHTPQRPSRGVGGIPQLPSLRISSLPAIVIQSTNEDSAGHSD